jgi:hypothetical protein
MRFGFLRGVLRNQLHILKVGHTEEACDNDMSTHENRIVRKERALFHETGTMPGEGGDGRQRMQGSVAKALEWGLHHRNAKSWKFDWSSCANSLQDISVENRWSRVTEYI